jgi:hypothetical protein
VGGGSYGKQANIVTCTVRITLQLTVSQSFLASDPSATHEPDSGCSQNSCGFVYRKCPPCQQDRSVMHLTSVIYICTFRVVCFLKFLFLTSLQFMYTSGLSKQALCSRYWSLDIWIVVFLTATKSETFIIFTCTSELKSESLYNWQSVGRSVSRSVLALSLYGTHELDSGRSQDSCGFVCCVALRDGPNRKLSLWGKLLEYRAIVEQLWETEIQRLKARWRATGSSTTSSLHTATAIRCSSFPSL